MNRRAARPPRVLYCSDTYPPQVNGVSVVTAQSIAGLRERGWTTAVVIPRYPERQARGVRGFPDRFDAAHHIVTIPSVSFPPYPDIRLAVPMLSVVEHAIRSFQPDLVHCATEFMLGRLGQVAAARAGLPIVTSYHTDFGRYTDAYGAQWLRPAVEGYLRRFHSRALRTYTPSERAREDLARMGVRNVEVWGRSIDSGVFSPVHRDESWRRVHGFDGKVLFLHVGRLAAEKDVRRILDAFALAGLMLPARSAHLVIAGGGPEEPALRDAAPPDVTFLGVLERTDSLPRLYASADAFLFASVTETLGLVVLEAMASGLPVIAPACGGVADHLHHGENGIVVGAATLEGEMAGAIVRLALDPELRQRLGQGARRSAEAVSWPGELDRLDASYREIRNLATRAGERDVASGPPAWGGGSRAHPSGLAAASVAAPGLTRVS